MREILFRGKRIDKGDWIEGNLLRVEHKDAESVYIIPLVTNGKFTVNTQMLNFISPCFEVIPETVGQYIGLTDRNGNKIFEDDIIEFDDGEEIVVELKEEGIFVLNRRKEPLTLNRVIFGNKYRWIKACDICGKPSCFRCSICGKVICEYCIDEDYGDPDSDVCRCVDCDRKENGMALCNKCHLKEDGRAFHE